MDNLVRIVDEPLRNLVESHPKFTKQFLYHSSPTVAELSATCKVPSHAPSGMRDIVRILREGWNTKYYQARYSNRPSRISLLSKSCITYTTLGCKLCAKSS